MELQKLPHWAGRLSNYYVVIRVEGRNKTIRRRYYRAVEREKYRLACLGICQIQIIACCRYLSSLRNRRNGHERLANLMIEVHPQFTFDFSNTNNALHILNDVIHLSNSLERVKND